MFSTTLMEAFIGKALGIVLIIIILAIVGVIAIVKKVL